MQLGKPRSCFADLLQRRTLYDNESITFNVHQLLRLQCLGHLGTLTFPCEDSIGQVLHLVSAAKFVAVQARKVPRTFELHLCLEEVLKGEAKRLGAKLEEAWEDKGSDLIDY